jgi:hypothetical protein
MSELPAGDTLAEQQINEEFEVAGAGHLARQAAGEIRYVSHQEAGRRLGLPMRSATEDQSAN